MASKKRLYDAEFREGAVRIVVETGKLIPEVAADLGIHSGRLHSWVSRARRNGSPSSDRRVAEVSPGGRLRESERAELDRLRAEAGEKDKRIRELEMERDVCKRFVALWVTATWQFARLPTAPQYWRATPTDALLHLGNDTSSITKIGTGVNPRARAVASLASICRARCDGSRIQQHRPVPPSDGTARLSKEPQP